MTDRVAEIQHLLATCTVAERRTIFRLLRQEFGIHSIEATLNAQAEVILEAVSRSSDLTIRGIRGIIAEATFLTDVVSSLQGWRDVTQGRDLAYDFLLTDGQGDVKVQVKMQRLTAQRPLMYRRTSTYAVETQRTRTGKDLKGKATRPYSYSDFDILAVSMQPSTGRWTDFMYTVARWLLPRSDDPSLLQTLQPVAPQPNDDWTNDFLVCVAWLRSTEHKRIRAAD